MEQYSTKITFSSTVVEYSIMGKNNPLLAEQYSGKMPYMYYLLHCWQEKIQKCEYIL